jgi:hypothetical protein
VPDTTSGHVAEQVQKQDFFFAQLGELAVELGLSLSLQTLERAVEYERTHWDGMR